MIISISGVSGSGKSSTAIMLAKKLKYKHYSMGDIQRELAKKHGMTTVEFSKLEAKDQKYDNERDEILANLGKTKNNFVIDAWLGAKFIPHAIKIFLDSDINIRAKRIFEETQKKKNMAGIKHKREADKNYKSVEETKETIIKKEEINRERWKRYYSFDFMDKKNYDVCIDTTDITIEQIVNAIIKMIKSENKQYKDKTQKI